MKIKPFKLERYYTVNEFSARYSLCNSDSEAMTINNLLSFEEDAKDKFHNLWLGYTESKGHPDLRRDIASIYAIINPENLLVCTGAQEPIFLFAQANLEPYDEVIVQSPCYQSLQSVPESIGCKVAHWNVKYKGDKPTFDIEKLKSMVNSKTKAIFLNAPHNPTGFHFSKEEQQAIVEIARANDSIIFCDEVYRELEHKPEYAIPAFADAYENGVSVGVMSKSYGLPGLRIGWIASQNIKILEKVAVLKEYTTICNAGPSEFLAGVALRNRKKILERNLDIIKENLPLYDAFFEKYNDLFSWHKPNAGPVALVKMHFDTDDMAFAERVLKEQSVLLLPGGVYDFGGFFRIGFGRTIMPKALEQFEKFVVANLVKA
ncbi:aminotransferase class I/II-fold pyridoxal phosphate-dependent enzyme [Maribacter algarum]|uniref:Aminotransferase class I/II-fold pyridoxal phosphate-dependent enzyme n=1 Tax=Maribacter algarum (ex Zhang et al. 2020) TaxID=2578118 RepID=A0A5S3PVJ0_9FLAO|nr:aminotransferase class I/II-fold pyridoxal phosphate-dependent enzyme [Maribacter algarum]TMM58995.1 aminotransferase class I/II-fold pyridoxal phosphate-dependent enzyme [Maribacter algarum]